MDARARALLPGLLLVALGLAGTAIAVYLTSVHYAKTPLVCSSSGLVNCEKVLNSGWSEVAGVPWSVGGIVWFGVLAVLGGLTLRPPEPRWLHPAQLIWTLIGLATIFYLASVEALALGVLCLWCTIEHVLIVVALLTALLRSPTLRAPESIASVDEPSPLPSGTARRAVRSRR